MNSLNDEDSEWFDDLEDTLSIENSDKVKSQMETLDRKKLNKSCRSPHSRHRQGGLVSNMMRCVVTDTTLEHSPTVRNYQVPLTPRTQRKYQSPLLSGRRVLSQIPRAAVSNSPLQSPRRARGGQERARVHASMVRKQQEKPLIVRPKVTSRTEESNKVTEGGCVKDFSKSEFSPNNAVSPYARKKIANYFTTPVDKEVIVMKGLLWILQDKLFSKWKERFIVLTSHYLQFFKKTSSSISEMGAFIMKVKLSDLSSLSLEDTRGYLTLVVYSQKEGRFGMRKTEGIRDWHDRMKSILTRIKDTEKRKMESTEEFWDRNVKDNTKNRDISGNFYSNMNPPRNSILKKSPVQSCSSAAYPLPSSPLLNRSTDDDSGLESLKTNTSDSGSSALHLHNSKKILEDAPKNQQNTSEHEDEKLYKKYEKVKSDSGKHLKDKHERGVSKTEYSKFKAKLPFITP